MALEYAFYRLVSKNLVRRKIFIYRLLRLNFVEKLKCNV